ncbi:MAG TPA: DNA polymerase III subunit alpha [Candidatus Binatia bacterium]|nr:DNA polymerase III subunit alpha [Candidatus Binatia bacterium]
MFIHLHCHSQYSFLRAVPSPQELVEAAVAAGAPAMALTDTNGLYGAVPFCQAARAAGIKPIVGTLLDVAPHAVAPGFSPASPPLCAQHAALKGGATSVALLLLAESAAGYSNLCRLLTLRHLEGRPVRLEELAAHREGLMVLHAPEASIADRSDGHGIRRAPTTEDSQVAQLKEIFGRALYLEAWHFSSPVAQAILPVRSSERGTAASSPGTIASSTSAASTAKSGCATTNLREVLRLAKHFGLPFVATNNVHFLRPEEYLHHRVLNAIRAGTLVSQIAPPEIVHPGAWFQSGAGMRWAFADYPEALRATEEIAEQCNLELPLGHTIFPEFSVPAGETPFSYLWKLCFEGARRRYQPLRPEVLARLTHELEIIDRLKLAPYFLLVWEIAEEARRRGIPAVARGSAASSIVTYCLGISRVCPLRWGLYFERFLNEERGDCPDIDLDICGARRDELLDYVYQRWGREHVAMISSFITMQARMAVREVAKVFGIAPGEVNHFTRRLPHRPVREIREAIRTLPECRDLPASEDPWKTILEVAERLDNFPRHLGIHPCGTVIAARPLTELIPLEVATKGIVVTQYDMNAVEALGLIKMDLLGQRGLTAVSLALDNIERATGTRPDFEAIPEDDPATQALVSTGRTMGIFQIESPGMRNLLRALRAKTLEEVCLALALIRPGASEYGSKETFLRRLRKQEPVRYPHERLEPILRESLGVCVYQEQVMQISQAAGGLTLAEADLVRRAQAKWKDPREREKFHAKFLKNAERLGLDPARRDEAWIMVEKFAGYGFCKAHAATYAEISWRIAWLKAHYPAEYLAAMCSAGAGFYHVSAYVEEAKRWTADGRAGIEVRLPSINHSRLEYSTEEGSPAVGALLAAPCVDAVSIEGRSKQRPYDLRTGGTKSRVCPPELASSSGERRRAMRIGLMQVRGLGSETIATILRERKEHGLFRSLEDFLARVPIERDEIETLIKCGAFDGVGGGAGGDSAAHGGHLTRPELLWRLTRNGIPHPAGAAPDLSPASPLFPDAALPAPQTAQLEAVSLTDYTPELRLRYEQELLEVCVSGHPLDRVPRNGEIWSSELAGIPRGQRGRRVILLGWLITFRHVGTKDYRNMMFCTFEDQRGTFEAVLFPEAYERYGALVFETRMLRVTGHIEEEGQINCDKLEPVKP